MKIPCWQSKKRDQQSSHAPIAVKKWMDRLELCMHQPAVDQPG